MKPERRPVAGAILAVLITAVLAFALPIEWHEFGLSGAPWFF